MAQVSTKKGLPGKPISKAPSSQISTLPKSSFASLGVDGAFIHGTQAGLDNNRPVSNLKTSKEMNSGASVRKSGRDTYGGDSYAQAQGGVGARDGMTLGGSMGAAKGNLARAAHPNSLSKSSSSSTTGLGGDRLVGTGAKFDTAGVPGRSGSMAMAMRGINGGVTPPTNKKPGSPPDLRDSRKGLNKGAKAAKNQ